MLVKQIDEKTRIILSKYSFDVLSSCFKLQRLEKSIFGFSKWRTKSWIYPSVIKNDGLKYIEEWLIWDEGESEKKVSEFEIGKSIINKC